MGENRTDKQTPEPVHPAPKKLSEGRLGKRQDVVNISPAKPAQNVNQSDPAKPPVDPPPKAKR